MIDIHFGRNHSRIKHIWVLDECKLEFSRRDLESLDLDQFLQKEECQRSAHMF